MNITQTTSNFRFGKIYYFQLAGETGDYFPIVHMKTISKSCMVFSWSQWQCSFMYRRSNSTFVLFAIYRFSEKIVALVFNTH